MEFKIGDTYEGSWNDSIMMDGKGKYYIEEGNLFIEGVWNNGKSIYGKIYYPNNNIYEGYINNSNCHWKGKLIYNNDFVNREMEGKGKYTYSDATKYEENLVKVNLKDMG